MKSKKFIIVFLIVLIICMCIIIATLFYLTTPQGKDENILNELQNNNENSLNEATNNNQNILNATNTGANELVNNTVDFPNNDENFTENMNIEDDGSGTDEMYDEQLEAEIQEMIQEEERQNKEKIDNFKLEISDNNMPSEIKDALNKSFDDVEYELKKCVYEENLSEGLVAEYNSYRTVNSGNSLIVVFYLNNEEASEVDILINLEDYSASMELY